MFLFEAIKIDPDRILYYGLENFKQLKPIVQNSNHCNAGTSVNIPKYARASFNGVGASF